MSGENPQVKPGPMDALLADLERHRRVDAPDCEHCHQWWPCDAARARDALADRDERIRGLLDQRDELTAENARLRERLEAAWSIGDDQATRSVSQFVRRREADAAVRRVRDLCAARTVEAEGGGRTDADPLWPSEVLAALDPPADPSGPDASSRPQNGPQSDADASRVGRDTPGAPEASYGAGVVGDLSADEAREFVENRRLRAWLDAQADALEGVRNLLTSGPIGQVSGERYIRADLIRAALEPPARTPSPCWAQHGVGVVGDPSAEESP